MNLDGTGVSSTDLIGYRSLSESALKGVMKQALRVAAEHQEMPGEHHFYITFLTSAPGVVVADKLKDQFPEDMTIVLQHQFWDLNVTDELFEVVLKFAGVPQPLRIPFSAVTRFFDPSVNFGVEFQPQPADDQQDTTDSAAPEDQADDTVAETADIAVGDDANTVVQLDAFRRK